MIELGEQLGFALEPFASLPVAGQLFWQYLDGNIAPELRITGSIHFTHSTGTDGRQDLVGAKLGTGGEHESSVSIVRMRWRQGNADCHPHLLASSPSYTRSAHAAPPIFSLERRTGFATKIGERQQPSQVVIRELSDWSAPITAEGHRFQAS